MALFKLLTSGCPVDDTQKHPTETPGKIIHIGTSYRVLSGLATTPSKNFLRTLMVRVVQPAPGLFADQDEYQISLPLACSEVTVTRGVPRLAPSLGGPSQMDNKLAAQRAFSLLLLRYIYIPICLYIFIAISIYLYIVISKSPLLLLLPRESIFDASVLRR